MIVRFRNIGDPATIQRVDPNDFAATVGTGVTLERATLAITADPVTRSINTTLLWLKHDDPRSHFFGPLASHMPEQNLVSSGFESYSMPQ